MAERILSQQQPIRATLIELRKGELMLTDNEFKTLECFVKVTKPFVDITEALGAEKWVTISTLTPLLHKILNIYLKVASTDASLLDPRFKSLPFLKPK